jgi:pantetheine-phosphate adenylyltransferase
MGKQIVICPGSFDPATLGHINIIERGLKTFDHIVVAIANNESKHAMFTPQERIDMMRELLQGHNNVEFDAFEGLLVDYAKRRGVKTILRGIRTVSDYEYELQMSLANRALFPELETIFMMTEGHLSYISSSIIKEVLALGGTPDKKMIHPLVMKKIKEKIRDQKKKG